MALLAHSVCLCLCPLLPLSLSLSLSQFRGNGTCFAERGSRNPCQRDMRHERRKEERRKGRTREGTRGKIVGMVPNRRRRRRRRHERKGKSNSFRVRPPRPRRASLPPLPVPSPSSLSPLAEVTQRNALIPNESRVFALAAHSPHTGPQGETVPELSEAAAARSFPSLRKTWNTPHADPVHVHRR